MTDPATKPSLSSHSTRDDASASRQQPPSYGSDPLVLGSDASISNPGTVKMHSANASWGKSTVWVLLVLLGLLIFISSFENVSNSQTVFSAAFFLSDYRTQTPITVYIACAVLVAIVPVYYAKLSDRVGRAEAFGVAFAFYFVGLVVMGSANRAAQLSAGDVIRFLGYAGITVLPAILIADITTLRFRGLALGLTSLLSFINTFIWVPFFNKILQGNTWRFGFFTFAIILPFLILPIVAIVVIAQRRQGKVAFVPPRARLAQRIAELDLVGLSILTLSVAFIVVATYFGLTSHGEKTSTSWASAAVIVLLVLGILLFPVFVFFEVKWKRSPVAYSRVFQSKIVVATLAVAFVASLASSISAYHQFMAYYIGVNPQYGNDDFYIRDSLKITRYGSAVAAGVVMALTRKSSKWLLIGGLLVELVGVAIMIRTGGKARKAEFVVCQIIQGIGAGFSQLAILVTAQASVIHADVASVTAFVFLAGALGDWFGSSIANGVWYKDILAILTSRFPTTSKAELIRDITTWSLGNRYPEADPIREALVGAFGTVSGRLCIISTCLLLVPIAITFFFVNTIELGNTQNAVDGQTLDGKTERVVVEDAQV